MLRIVQLLRSLLLILITVVAQGIQFLRWALSSRAALGAEVVITENSIRVTLLMCSLRGSVPSLHYSRKWNAEEFLV
jgi:hypothetical protein